MVVRICWRLSALKIRTVSIIGLGALGVLYGHHLSCRLPKENLRIISDSNRIKRYQRENVYCNGIVCDFNFVTPEEKTNPSDLIIFAVKFNGLADAIKAIKNQVGPKTIIISLLNGISSEEIIAQTYGAEKIVYSVAQGMDAVKIGNKLNYHSMGQICFGDMQSGSEVSEKVNALRSFFDKVELPYILDNDMRKRMWGKFMLNVGVNQTVAVFECDYGGIQREGVARDTMISAMREVIALSEKEKVGLSESDLEYWLKVLDVLNPKGKPSMRQDMEAGRYSEVELFAGTVLSSAKKHELSCPINHMLYGKIKEMESRF